MAATLEDVPERVRFGSEKERESERTRERERERERERGRNEETVHSTVRQIVVGKLFFVVGFLSREDGCLIATGASGETEGLA